MRREPIPEHIKQKMDELQQLIKAQVIEDKIYQASDPD
jgi:hypothetical protein